MSALRSALDELLDGLRAEDLGLVDDDALVADLDELERTSRAIEAERSRRLTELERRGPLGADGHLSVTSWLVARHLLPPSVAASTGPPGPSAAGDAPGGPGVRLRRDRRGGGRAARAAHGTCPEAFAALEGVLVDAARVLPHRDLLRVVQRFREAADLHGAEAEHERRCERRRLHVSPTLGGMVRVDGELDPEGGQTLITALRAVLDVEARGRTGSDPRTPGQRRADALGETCRSFLDRPDRPQVAGERPHVVVTVDLEALRGRAGVAELADVGPITPGAARRLACDASVSRVIVGPGSRPLEAGRSTRVVPATIRRALWVRDRGCRFPGCGRPPGWCDAHHVVHWADGGTTGSRTSCCCVGPTTERSTAGSG